MENKTANSTLKTNSNTNDEYENAHYDRWFVVQSVDDDRPLSKLSPFAIDKATKCAVGTVKTIRRLRKGDLLIEITSAAQSRALNKLDNLAGCPVTASPHRTLNSCKGVIRCRPLVDCDKDEILEELQSQGVTDIYNILTKDDSGGRRNTNTFIITFKATSVPKHIKIGYLRVPVEIYIPNPLRCFNCQKFGHSKNACKGTEICAKCGQAGHGGNSCSNEMKCPNCSGSHAAYSKDCPKWIMEKNVQRVKAERGISFTEARKIAAVENENRTSLGSRTAAAVVSSRSGPTPLTTRSVNVQTDLTWPNGQERPILVPPSACKTQTCQTTSAVPAAKPCSSVDNSRSPGKGQPDRHPLEEQQPHLRIRRRRKQDEPSDVLKTNPLARVRRRTKGHG